MQQKDFVCLRQSDWPSRRLGRKHNHCPHALATACFTNLHTSQVVRWVTISYHIVTIICTASVNGTESDILFKKYINAVGNTTVHIFLASLTDCHWQPRLYVLSTREMFTKQTSVQTSRTLVVQIYMSPRK